MLLLEPKIIAKQYNYLTCFRVAHENKERRRQWALRKTQPKSKKNVHLEVAATEKPEELPSTGELLPSNIVEILAAREKYTFFYLSLHSRYWASSARRCVYILH